MLRLTSPEGRTDNLLCRLSVLVLFALLTTLPVLAQTSTPGVTTAQLREAGVQNLDDFWPVQFGPEGRTIYFYEETRAGERPPGVFGRLWEFRFRSDGVLSTQRCLPLQMPKPLQMSLTPDGRGAVLMARDGASFWHLDLASGELREFITPALGKTRFRSDPQILWVDNGKLWAVGYTLDANQVRGHHTLVELRPERTGEDAIVPTGLNVDELLAHYQPWKVQSWVNPDLGWVGGLRDGVLEMAVWQREKGWTPLGRYKQITSAWNEGTHQLMTADGLDGRSKAMVYDAATGQRWDLPEIDGAYDYPFVCQDGSTILLVEGPREGERMKILFARKADNFKPQVLPGFDNVQKGYLRLSPDGRTAVYRNQSGIFMVPLPR